MDLLDAICGRRAIRRYKLDRPTEETLRELVEAATWAPSAMNGQRWHFTIITRSQMLDDISRHAKAWIRDREPWLAENREMQALVSDPQYHLLHHAPALVVISAPASDKWSAEACAVAAQNLMLAATSHGLGSCWIGLAQDWLNSPIGHDMIGLPENEKVVAPIVVGYANEVPEPVCRRKPAITWIRDAAIFQESDGEAAQPVPVPGLFGGLVRH